MAAKDIQPPGFHSVTPRIFVTDVGPLAGFLRAVFGATGDVHPDRPAEIRIGDSVVMVASAGEREAFPAFLYIYVDDADATFRRAIDAGAVSVEVPFDTPYGDRRAMVRDPFGNVFQIAHRAPSPEAVPTGWEQRVADAWASFDQRSEEEFLALIEGLAAEQPETGNGLFERACSLDSTGYSDLAVPLYQGALKLGLSGLRRRRAVIQLASSLRNLDRSDESVALLTAELNRSDAASDHLDDAVRAFLALALADTGRERTGLALALVALAPHLPRYQRSLADYAGELSPPWCDLW